MRKPSNVTLEQAAAVPIAALTALQGLRDKGQIQAGQSVLINGASGGVGTMAIQVAKSFGAEVTAVCRTRNVDQARALGADRVIDYTQENFTKSGRRYDLLFDVAGSRSWSECKRVLTPEATLVMVGAPKGGRLLGPLGHIVKVRLAALRSSQKVVFFIAKFNKPDMEVLRELLEAGNADTGRRAAVHVERGRRRAELHGRRPRPGEARHHDLRSALDRHESAVSFPRVAGPRSSPSGRWGALRRSRQPRRGCRTR